MTHIDQGIVDSALERASELMGKEDASEDVRLIVEDEFSYFVAGGQVLAAISEVEGRQRAYVPLHAGILCLN